jgi:hypothetical protein
MTAPDQGINLDPVAAKAAGNIVYAAGAQLATSRRAAGGRLEAANATKPWGNDEMGKAFEQDKGDKPGYLTTANGVLAAWRDYSELTSNTGVSINKAVDTLTGADEHNDGRVTAVLKEL